MHGMHIYNVHYLNTFFYRKIDILKYKFICDLVVYCFQSVFLPQGYPDSVSSDYLDYQIWDTIQVSSNHITKILTPSC